MKPRGLFPRFFNKRKGISKVAKSDMEEELAELNKNENITDNDDGSKQVELEHPFDWGKGENKSVVTSVKIPRIKAHHMRGINGKALENGDMDEVFKLIQKLISEPRAFIDALDMADIQVIGEVLSDFLPDGPTTGGTV